MKVLRKYTTYVAFTKKIFKELLSLSEGPTNNKELKKWD